MLQRLWTLKTGNIIFCFSDEARKSGSQLQHPFMNGYISLEIFQKSSSIQQGFSLVGSPHFLYVEQFGAIYFFSIHNRINNIPPCSSVSKCSFQSRYLMMIDEAVRPTVADRAVWQEFSVIERNLKYLFHLLC